MSDSSRPLATMPPPVGNPRSFGYRYGSACPRSGASCSVPALNPSPSPQVCGRWLPALALFAAALPSFATVRHPVAPPHHPAPERLSRTAVHRAPPIRTAVHARHERVSAVAPPERTHRILGDAVPAAKGRRTSASRAGETAPYLGRRGRLVAADHRAPERDRGQETPLEPRLKHPARNSDAETAANRSTQDRVHAWYQAHATAPTLASATKPVSRPVSERPSTAQKATSQDFDRAAEAQRRTIHFAQEQNARQTTAADDDADAETQIPSTAPTEREPAPFQRGDPNASVIAPSPVGHRDAASSVRQPPAMPAAAGNATSLRPRPRSADPTPTANPLFRADIASAARSNPAESANGPSSPRVAAAADSSPAAIRAVHAEAAGTAGNASKGGLSLPAPPVSAARKSAPAAAVVQKNARKPKLDPTVAQGMAEETFDDDTPVTAKSAVVLATAPTGGSLTSAVARASAAEDDSESAASRASSPGNLFDGRGHLQLVPPMKGSHEILVHQNQMAVADGLDRIQDDGQLAEMRRSKLLVALPDDDSIYPNDGLPLNRRYARPWTVRFLRDMARAHYARFGTPLIVTSAARTVEFQRRLIRTNGNAAPPSGDVASPHLYGQAVDLAKRGMSLTEITWMRAYLTPVEDQGKIDVEEEFQQSCFHVSVYRRYLGAPAQKKLAPRQDPKSPTLLEAKSAPAAAPKKSRLPTALLATGLR